MFHLSRNISFIKIINRNTTLKFAINQNFHKNINGIVNIATRNINTKIFDQLLYKGLICSSFPSNVNINELLSRKETIYAGFDATNNSLHIGNLLVLVSLFHLLNHGHRVIVLVGDATAQIGDPSGKTTERPELPKVEAQQNANDIEQNIHYIYDNFKKHFAKQKINDNDFIVCRNSEWYNHMNVIPFVQKYARHLRMGDMLNKTSIKERLESQHGLSFAEFSYQTFQAYDWLHLYQKYACRFQIGGVDQMVNIHNGYDLIKKVAQKYSYGLFVPLITDQKGNKIGKSEGKAIYLNQKNISAFNFYQYFMRIPDVDISRYFKLFSFRPQMEIETLIQNQLKSPKPWYLQNRLANEITLLVHGEQGLESAKRLTRAFFEKDLDLLGSLPQNEIQELFLDASKFHLEFIPGELTAMDLAIKTQCFDSNLNAIKTIQEGGFYVNYVKIMNPGKIIDECYILKNNITIVSVGKRNHRLVKWL